MTAADSLQITINCGSLSRYSIIMKIKVIMTQIKVEHWKFLVHEIYCKIRDGGAIFQVGELTSDLKWGGLKYFSLSKSLFFRKF